MSSRGSHATIVFVVYDQPVQNERSVLVAQALELEGAERAAIDVLSDRIDQAAATKKEKPSESTP
jgi:hypothetical protein